MQSSRKSLLALKYDDNILYLYTCSFCSEQKEYIYKQWPLDNSIIDGSTRFVHNEWCKRGVSERPIYIQH